MSNSDGAFWVAVTLIAFIISASMLVVLIIPCTSIKNPDESNIDYTENSLSLVIENGNARDIEVGTIYLKIDSIVYQTNFTSYTNGTIESGSMTRFNVTHNLNISNQVFPSYEFWIKYTIGNNSHVKECKVFETNYWLNND